MHHHNHPFWAERMFGHFRRHAGRMGRRHGHHHHFGHGFRPTEEQRMERILGHGDLRTVALLLIEEQPRHGYELIKLIETKSSGMYSPSPGTIYPTLTYLEDTGLVKTTSANDKKQYSITQEGKAYLNENRESATAILKRLEEIGARQASAKAEAARDPFEGDERSEMRAVFHDLMHELKSKMFHSHKHKKELLKVLKNALDEIRAIGDSSEE